MHSAIRHGTSDAPDARKGSEPTHSAFRQTALHAIKIAGVLAGLIALLFARTEPASGAGSLHVQSVLLVALGTTKGDAEYAVRLANVGSKTGPIASLEIEYSTADGKSHTLNIPSSVESEVADSLEFALFVDNPDLRSVTIKYFILDPKSGRIDMDQDRFFLDSTDSVSPLEYDDTASWIGPLPSVFAFQEPSDGNAGVERWGAFAPDTDKSGSVDVIVDLNPGGTIFRVELESSSGIGLLDEAALKAALETKYDPAFLITPKGSEPTPNRFRATYASDGG